MGCASSTPFLSAHGGPVKNMDSTGEDGSQTDMKDGQVKESIIGAVTNIGHSIGDVVKNGTHDIKEMVTTSIEKVPDEIKAHVNKLLNDDKKVIENSLDDLNQTIDSETNTIKENAAKLSKTFDDEIENAVNDTEQKLTDAKENISDVLENVKDDMLDINSVDSMDSLKTTIPEPEIENALKNNSDDELNSPTPKPTYSELEILKSESDAMLQNNSTPTNDNLANQHKCLSKKLDDLAKQFENFVTRFQMNEGTKNESKNIATSTTSSLEANPIKNENVSKIIELEEAEIKKEEDIVQKILEKDIQQEEVMMQEQNPELIELEDAQVKKEEDIVQKILEKDIQQEEVMMQEQNQEPEIKMKFPIDNVNVTNMESGNGTEREIAEQNQDDSKQGKVLENPDGIENNEIESVTIGENVLEFTAETSNVLNVNDTELNAEKFKVEENQNIELDVSMQNRYENNSVSTNFNENIAHSENKELEPETLGPEDKIEFTPAQYNETSESIKKEEDIVTDLNNAELTAEKFEVEEKQNTERNDLAQEDNTDINVSTNSNKDVSEEINENKIESHSKHSERPLKKYAQSLPESNEIYSIILKTDGTEVMTQNNGKKQIRADPEFKKSIKNIQALGMLSFKKQDIIEHKIGVQDKTKDLDIFESPNQEEDIKIETELEKKYAELNATNMMEYKINDPTTITTQNKIQEIEINLECPTPNASENSENTEVIRKFVPKNLLHNLTKIFGLKTNLENEINSATKPSIVTNNMKQVNVENLDLESTENQTNEIQFQEEKFYPIINDTESHQKIENKKEESQFQNSLDQSDQNLLSREDLTVSKIKDDTANNVMEDSHQNFINNTVETDIALLNVEDIQIPEEVKSDKIDVSEVIETEPKKKKKKAHKKIKSVKVSQTIIDNDIGNESKSILEEKLTEDNEINGTSPFTENLSRAPTPIFVLAHRRTEFRKLGWSFLLANLDTLREIRDSSESVVGNEILTTLNILNYFVVAYDKKHRTIFDRINTKLEILRDFLREKFTHFYFYEKFKELFKTEEEPKLIPQKIMYESETEEETEEIEEMEEEEAEEESEEEETDDELPALDLNKTAEELLNDIEFLVNKDPNEEDINSIEEEVLDLSENEISEPEIENNEFDLIKDQVNPMKNYEQKDDELKENDNQEKIPQLITSNSIESNKSKKIDEVMENIQAQDILTQMPDTQEYSLLTEEIEKPKDTITNENEKQNGTEKPSIKKTPNFLKVTPFKLKKKKTKKKFVNRIPIDPTNWEELADTLAKKNFKNYEKLSRNYSSESVWSGDAATWKKPNSLYLVFGNNFLRTPKIKIIESGHTNQWTQRTKRDPTELDVYTGKLMTDNDIFQESKQDKRLKWKSFELEMKASQLEMNKKIYNLTDTEDYPIGKSQTEITLNWLKNDIKRFKEEYGAFNRSDFDHDSDFDNDNYAPWTSRSNRLPYLRNINQKNRYHNFNSNPYRNNYHHVMGSERSPYRQNQRLNGIYRFPPNRNLHHKYDRNIYTKNQHVSNKVPEKDVYYSSSNSAKSFKVSEDARKVEEIKIKKHLKERKENINNSGTADSDLNSKKSMKKDTKNQKNKKIKSNSNENSDEHVTSKESNNKESEIKSDDEKKVKNESNIDSEAKSDKSIDSVDDLKKKDHIDDINDDINLKKSEEEENEEPNNKTNLSKQSSKDSRTSSIKSKKSKISNISGNKTSQEAHHKYNDFNDNKKHIRKPEKNVDDLIQYNLSNQKPNISKNKFKGKTEDRQHTRRSDTDSNQSIVEDKRKHRTKAWLEKQGKNSTHIESSEIDSNGDPIEKKNFKLPYIKSQYLNKKIGNENFQDQSFSEDSDINGKYNNNNYEEQSSRNRQFKESFEFMHKDFSSDSDENQYDKYHQRSKFMNESQKYYNYYDYE